MNASQWPIVIVESPFAGDVDANRLYAIEACVDCLRRQEVPYASHLFFSQFLDDLKPEEREQGLTAGYAIWRAASKIAFYVDRGVSSGMRRAWDRALPFALANHFVVECRSLRGLQNPSSLFLDLPETSDVRPAQPPAL